MLLLFFFYCYRAHRDLHSFPTRRSSDLEALSAPRHEGALVARHARARSESPRRGVRDVRCDRDARADHAGRRSEEHTSELQSHSDLVCRLLLEKKNNKSYKYATYKQRVA